jgi:uncharacterized protein
MKKRFGLGNSFMISAILLGLLFKMSIEELINTTIDSIISSRTILLTLVVMLILILSKSMDISGQMKRLLSNFRGLVASRTINLIIFPALIGLLPMPGGAVFSAPLLKEVASGHKFNPAILSFVNYWFRHIWEYFWPLYPAILLVPVIANIDYFKFSFIMFPFFILSLGIGIIFLRFKIRNIPKFKTIPINTKIIGIIIKESLPICLTIILGIFGGLFINMAWPNLSCGREIALAIALVISIVWVWYSNNLSLDKKTIKTVLNKKLISIAYMIIAIMVFKEVLYDSNASQNIVNQLTYLHIPLTLIIIILPFIIGFICGIAVAFVGISFPLIISLTAASSEGGNIYLVCMLAYMSGFMGVMLSPVHLCLILTNKYFEVTLFSVYKYLYKISLVILTCGIAYYFLLKQIF